MNSSDTELFSLDLAIINPFVFIKFEISGLISGATLRPDFFIDPHVDMFIFDEIGYRDLSKESMCVLAH